MTAKLAQKLVAKSIYKEIKDRASEGFTYIFFYKKLPEIIIKELENKGFEVRNYDFQRAKNWFSTDKEVGGYISWEKKCECE